MEIKSVINYLGIIDDCLAHILNFHLAVAKHEKRQTYAPRAASNLPLVVKTSPKVAGAAAVARWPDFPTASSLGQNCHVRDQR